eukprot:scaffold22559_cov111-Cylindrotheca_fusiformis.AAC.26
MDLDEMSDVSIYYTIIYGLYQGHHIGRNRSSYFHRNIVYWLYNHSCMCGISIACSSTIQGVRGWQKNDPAKQGRVKAGSATGAFL